MAVKILLNLSGPVKLKNLIWYIAPPLDKPGEGNLKWEKHYKTKQIPELEDFHQSSAVLLRAELYQIEVWPHKPYIPPSDIILYTHLVI
jgi:hypothetical protein